MSTDASAATLESTFSNAQPVRKFILLSIASLGLLYPPYWMYRNLKILKAHKRLSISPGWRTFAAFIPLIGLLFFKDQLQLFGEVAGGAGAPTRFSPWGRTLAFNLVSAAAFELPLALAVLTAIAAMIFLLPVQQALNEYWTIEQPGAPLRQRFSGGEVAFLVTCGVTWVLLLVLSIAADRLVVVG
jgi:hypothetical protein